MPKIAVLPGDGIGPEIVAQAVRVLTAVAPDVEATEALVGGAAYDAAGVLRDCAAGEFYCDAEGAGI